MAGDSGPEWMGAAWSKGFCPLGMFLQKEIKENALFFALAMRRKICLRLQEERRKTSAPQGAKNHRAIAPDNDSHTMGLPLVLAL